MKIGIFDPYLDTMSGGEKYMLTAAVCLSSKYDVAIFWNIQQSEFIRQESLRKFGLNLENINFTDNIFKSPISKVQRLVESRKYDYIIYLSDGSIPFVLSRLVVHFQTPVEWVSPNKMKTYFKLLLTRRIICNSNFTKSYIDKKFRVNSTVLYPPITIAGDLKKQSKEKLILNIGRYGVSEAGSSYKKQEVLVDAFCEMIKLGLKGWRLVLLVSGTNKELVGLEQLKKKYPKMPFEILSNVDNRTYWDFCDKAKIYWHAAGYGEDLAVHPDRAEHFGMSTVEAMSRGAVPVVIDAGGQREIVIDGVSGILWKSKDELISKSLDLIENKDKWTDLSANAVSRAQHFSKEKFCSELLSVLV